MSPSFCVWPVVSDMSKMCRPDMSPSWAFFVLFWSLKCHGVLLLKRTCCCWHMWDVKQERRILVFEFAQNYSPSNILMLPFTCRSVTHVLEKKGYIKLGPDNISNDFYYIIFSKKCQILPPFSGFSPFINIPTRIIYSTFWRSSWLYIIRFLFYIIRPWLYIIRHYIKLSHDYI
jgi:hypothetical protein